MTVIADPKRLEHLQTQGQIELLDIIDALRAEGLSEYTALPQLIVCGDQSSGKSSVLEAISSVPFPRKETLCTRFATEVILRRASDESITVSLVPGKSRSPQERDTLSGFHHNLSTPEEFPALFDEATRAMGLDALGSRAFSEDILRVEVSGPAQPQLTVVDLPGLIHSPNKKQSADDISLVHKLVGTYMKSERSIILAVVSAMNEFANQIVLQKAREVDPNGERTIGIITKPDTLRAGTTLERSFLALARNEDVKFERGWHVVRNLDLGAGEAGKRDRDCEESVFFEESSFKSLPPSSVGIVALRLRLSQVLFSQVQSELPKLVEDIRSGVTKALDELAKLGPSRVTLEEQKAFLISVSQEFQILSNNAVNGQYSDPFFADHLPTARRLCAVIANSHDDFEIDLRKNGARWIVSENKGRKTSRGRNSKYRTREQAIDDVQDLLRRSRGRELPGLVNPLLVGEIFRQYSEPWEGIAQSHVRLVWESTKAFIVQVLRHLTDVDVTRALLFELLEPLMDEKLKLAESKVDELLAVYKDHPATLNHYFQENMAALEVGRQQPLIEGKLREIFSRRDTLDKEDIPLLLSAMHLEQTPDMRRNAAEAVYDNMAAFYKTAMKVFLDNVPTFVIQEVIVNQVPRMFCPKSVFAMEPDLVRKIASESDAKILQRQELSRKLKTLETGHRICKQYVSRETSDLREPIDSPRSSSSGDFSQDEDAISSSDDAVDSVLSGSKEPWEVPPADEVPIEASAFESALDTTQRKEPWEVPSADEVPIEASAFESVLDTTQREDPFFLSKTYSTAEVEAPVEPELAMFPAKSGDKKSKKPKITDKKKKKEKTKKLDSSPVKGIFADND